ncbi:MAG: hypothetical protein ABI843_09750 [Dokdonella sp.]
MPLYHVNTPIKHLPGEAIAEPGAFVTMTAEQAQPLLDRGDLSPAQELSGDGSGEALPEFDGARERVIPAAKSRRTKKAR